MTIRRLMLAGIALAAPFASEVAALTFAEVPSLEAIAAKAPLAFRGVVLRVEHANAPLDATHDYPYTVTHLRALACYRGCQPGEEIAIMRIGGPRKGDTQRYLIIPGTASFATGEEVVIFSDDVEQPFFGTFYGDHGALRVARADSGERVVLSYHRSFLQEVAGRFRADPTRRCAPVPGNPGECSSVARRPEPSGDEDGAPSSVPPTPPAVTPEMFDRQMADIVRANPMNRPAQTVSKTKEAFERALAQLFRRASTR